MADNTNQENMNGGMQNGMGGMNNGTGMGMNRTWEMQGNMQTADEVATLKAENARLQQTVNQMTGVIINPMVLAPSQAVLTQATAAKTTAAAGAGS